MTDKYHDISILECERQAQRLIAEGGMVFQKFTCDHCGSRQTMPEPNKFYIGGNCEACGKPTDIARKGCGFALIMSTDMPRLKQLVADWNRKRGMQ
jgi:hypothetical protein